MVQPGTSRIAASPSPADWKNRSTPGSGVTYPLVIVLVDLEEGTRLTSELVDCEPEDVDFGLPVEMVIQEDPDGFKIPVFRLAGEH